MANRRYLQAYGVLAPRDAARRAQRLLISYGVGRTASALAATPSLETIDVVDVSADVLD